MTSLKNILFLKNISRREKSKCPSASVCLIHQNPCLFDSWGNGTLRSKMLCQTWIVLFCRNGASNGEDYACLRHYDQLFRTDEKSLCTDQHMKRFSEENPSGVLNFLYPSLLCFFYIFAVTLAENESKRWHKATRLCGMNGKNKTEKFFEKNHGYAGMLEKQCVYFFQVLSAHGYFKNQSFPQSREVTKEIFYLGIQENSMTAHVFWIDSFVEPLWMKKDSPSVHNVFLILSHVRACSASFGLDKQVLFFRASCGCTFLDHLSAQCAMLVPMWHNCGISVIKSRYNAAIVYLVRAF